MRNKIFLLCLLGATLAANGQEVVHGLGGKVAAINTATGTIKFDTDDGSLGLFAVYNKPEKSLSFQKGVKALTVPAAGFNKKDEEVVIFYIGTDAIRTTVALADLGPGPLQKVLGTVIKHDKHSHLLTLKNADGAEISFHITSKTLAETSDGVVTGDNFDAHKGDQLWITAATANNSDALFIRPPTS